MKFFRTLHWRLMAILFLLVISLMIIIGTFLIYSVEDTYYKEFKSDIERRTLSLEDSQILSDKIISTSAQYPEEIFRAFKAYFQIDDTTRKGYLLDDTGDIILPKSIEEIKIEPIEITKNIILAMAGETGNEISDQFFDFAKPVISENKVKYILYLKQDRNTINEIIASLKEIILYAVFITLIVAVFLSYLLSRAITVPLYKLKARAEKMAEGDFTPIRELKSGDEISELADKFNYMSKRLKNTLTEISKEKNKVETLLQNMNDGVIAFDFYGSLIHANSSAVNLLNLESDKQNFKQIFEMIDVSLSFDDIISSNDKLLKEYNIVVGNKCLKLFFAKFDNEKGDSEGVIVVIQDITEQEKLEEMRKDFVANVSHELKTPITSIRGYSETLLEGEVDKDTEQKFLDVINSEAERMSRIVSELLQLSKMDYKETTMNKIEFNISEIVKKLVDHISIETLKKNQEIIFDSYNNGLMAYADVESIEQVILNVLTNAMRYTNDGGKIQITLEDDRENIRIKVKDNGIGIPKKDLSRVFERFYRVDKARTRERGGTGLGLSIAKKMIESNNGEIYIDSEFGKWTEVTIVIPTSEIYSNQSSENTLNVF